MDMDMDMDMDMGSSGDMGFVPLDASGLDFSNDTQAADFLEDLLDDTYLQVVSNQYARYFWYGIVVFVGVVAIWNLMWKVILRTRYATLPPLY